MRGYDFEGDASEHHGGGPGGHYEVNRHERKIRTAIGVGDREPSEIDPVIKVWYTYTYVTYEIRGGVAGEKVTFGKIVGATGLAADGVGAPISIHRLSVMFDG